MIWKKNPENIINSVQVEISDPGVGYRCDANSSRIVFETPNYHFKSMFLQFLKVSWDTSDTKYQKSTTMNLNLKAMES